MTTPAGWRASAPGPVQPRRPAKVARPRPGTTEPAGAVLPQVILGVSDGIDPAGRVVGRACHQHRVGGGWRAARPGPGRAVVGADIDRGRQAVGGVEIVGGRWFHRDCVGVQ